MMTDHEIKLALGDLQRQMRDLNGHAPPGEADFMDVHPHDDPAYKLAEAVDFYAHSPADAIAADGGRLARETLDEIREQTRDHSFDAAAETQA